MSAEDFNRRTEPDDLRNKVYELEQRIRNLELGYVEVNSLDEITEEASGLTVRAANLIRQLDSPETSNEDAGNLYLNETDNRLHYVDPEGLEFQFGYPMSYHKMAPLVSDFIGGSETARAPFVAEVLGAGGVISNVSSVAQHPGIVRFGNNSTTNGGGRLYTDISSFLKSIQIQGGEVFECVFRFLSDATSSNYAIGFMDTIGAATPTDGVYIGAVGNTLSGVSVSAYTYSNGSTTNTSFFSSPQFVVDQWYWARVALNSDASQADFVMKIISTDTSYTASITTNIPSESGRQIVPIVKAWRTNTTNTNLMDVDWIAVYNSGNLTRA